MTIPLNVLRKLGEEKFDKFLQDDELKVTYSQLGEDCVLFELLINRLKILKGYYVDLGCFHPRKYSNTFVLTLLGWKGLNVDASHFSIEQFNLERPNDTNIWSGVIGPNTDNQLVDYYKFNPPAASTLSKTQAEIWQNQFHWRLLEVCKVNAQGVNQLIHNHKPPGQSIDYLNIDIEGLDQEIILNLDFTRYKPRVISVEIHFTDITKISDNPVFKRLSTEGYKIFSIILMTYIFYLE